MSEALLAEAIVADLRADCVARYYGREWRQLSAIDKLGKKLSLRKNRLGLQGPSFGIQRWDGSQPNS
jgi:hypothetical protein